jgi:hypothetical protein
MLAILCLYVGHRQSMQCSPPSKRKKGEAKAPPDVNALPLESLYVLRLKALRPLDDIELYCLAFLQATETVAADRREVHENVFAGLTADKAETFGVVKPFHCSLFHCLNPIVF